MSLQVAFIDFLMFLGLGQSEKICSDPSQLKHSIFLPLERPLTFSLKTFFRIFALSRVFLPIIPSLKF